MRYYLQWIPRSAVAAIVCLLLSLGLMVTPPLVKAYSCGSGTTGHCYGTAYWQGPTRGGQTTEYIAHIYANNGSDNLIDNEIWVMRLCK